LNVKRIAALAAGTALVGAAVAAAGAITYSNTPIISESGVPQVKVVVGENAAASDGVVAANIAAMIGNLAWRTQAVSATVGGKDQVSCSVTGGAGGAGTCAISNKKVWLNVTVPGTVSGAVEFRTLINDWVDKKLENRNQTSDDDQYNQANDPSPFEFSQAVKKFTANDFPALQTGSITDTYANVGYTEEQTLWIRATTKYDDSLKQVIGFEPDMAYQIKFTQDQYGIPVATCNPLDGAIFPGYGSPQETAETDRVCSDTDRTDRHRVLISFLGEDYIISDMEPPNATVTDSSDVMGEGVQEGGSIKLAKESAYGIVHVGENLSTGSYYVKLADITTPTTQQFTTFASIQIYDMNNNLLKEDQIGEGATYTWTAPDGSKIRIKVYKNNPGYYAYAKWAEMAIYSKEFELRDTEQVSDQCTDWKVYLFWKNKDPSKDSKYVDSLRQIIIRDEGNNPNVKMVAGDTQDIICSPVVWQLQYNGLNCADPGDYDALGMGILQRTFTLNAKGDTTCADKTRLTDANVLRVTSGLSSPFTVSAGSMTASVSEFYVNLGTNLLNMSYSSSMNVESVTGGNDAPSVRLTPILGDTWTSQTTFTVIGRDADGNLLYTNPGTTTTGTDTLTLTTPTGTAFAMIDAVVADAGNMGTRFNMSVQNGTGSYINANQMRIGWYNDAGELIWAQPGETECDFRGGPTGTSAVLYDPGDGERQPFGFGAGAFGNSPVWCSVGYPPSGGNCQLSIDNETIGSTQVPNERYISFQENAGNSPENYDYARLVLQQKLQAGTVYQFVDPLSGGSLDTTPDKMNYTGVGIGPAPFDGPQGVGFITDRGTVFTSIAQSSAAFKIAKKVCEAQYFMKSSGSSPNAPTQIGPLSEGQSTTGLAGGIVITVTQIAQDVGTCTAAAGSAQCQVSGLDALTATPSVTSTVIPTDLDTSANKLVVLDRDADMAATLIVVGGNTVNTVADDIIRTGTINLQTDQVVVRAIGTNRILVAGYTAQDTVTAGDQFIQALIAAKTA